MAGRRTAGLLVVVAVAFGVVLVGTVGGTVSPSRLDGPPASTAPSATAPGAAGPATTQETRPDIDTATTRIVVHPNGSATWSVEIRTALTNETDRQDYRRFQAAFRNDTEQYLGPFRERITDLVDTAGTVTGRPMAARSFTATTRVQQTPREWGIVEYRFRWAGFAAVRNGTLYVGDVFESGYYLAPDDSLVVEAPDGYRIADPRPAPQRRGNGTVRWVGPLDFADRRPSVRLMPVTEQRGDGGRTPGTGTGSPPGTAAGSAASGPPVVPIAWGLLLAVLVGGGYVAVRRRGTPGSPDTTGDDASGGAPGPADRQVADLVTDEERVVDLLTANGGRMRQADISDQLEWSAPKTSRVLSDMAEEGTVEKLRLGNENVIDLSEDH